jgi:hypothetical protein
MYKSIGTFLIFLVYFILPTDVFAQSFYTGAIGVTQSNGGRTRVFSNNLTTRQIDRISLLVGTSSTAVFDYNEDQNGVVSAATVTSPTLSDFEVTSTIDNSYNSPALPPNVEAQLNIHGWNNGAYLLVKVNVKNNEAQAINASIGLEIIPQVDGAYGNETVQWDATSKTVLMNKTEWVGIKFFSGLQTALRAFEWFSGYGNDSVFYSWLTQNSFDAPFTAGVDGAVAVLGQNPISIDAGQSTDFYYGISIGTDQASCLSNMSLCEAKYNLVVPVELTSFTASASGNAVNLNWSTATEINNRGFEIQRKSSTGNFLSIAFVEGKGTTQETQKYFYSDRIIESGKYSYRLKQVDFNGAYSYSNIVEVDARIPNKFGLNQNYPNPFNPTTTISYEIAKETNVVLKVYDAIGDLISTLINEMKPAGTYEIVFDASNFSNGVYFYQLQAGDFTAVKKLILMK